ncbi:adenylate kinase [Rugosimonospora acidiphila]|uniref:Adenylate kinase n=1 Tax=Rugosimonospora acidiphila TaxID=556531 RepID=A0ABP9RGH9_9ACTN
MRLIVLGPPGSDRGTIADLIGEQLGVPVLRVSDVFQAAARANTPAAVQAMRHMNAGELVPEDVSLSMIRDRLSRPDVADGFVLDGWAQAVPLDGLLSDLGAPLDRVIDLVLSDAEVLRRLTGRRLCRACGKLWHVEFAAPTRPDTCDNCGGELSQREDDSPERVTAGMGSYRPFVAPALDHFRPLGKLISIDATLPQAEIVAVSIA